MTRDEILKVWADLFNGEPPNAVAVLGFAVMIHDKTLEEAIDKMGDSHHEFCRKECRQANGELNYYQAEAIRALKIGEK